MAKEYPKAGKAKEAAGGKKAEKPKGKVRVTERTPKGEEREVKDDEKRWKAESALGDFERAEGHKSDPELMGHVGRVRDERVKKLANIKVDCAPKIKR